MRLIAIIAFSALLITPCIAALDDLSVATTYHYQSHDIAFDIPANWSLVSDQWNNSTQTDGTLLTDAKMELTDNQSTIRLDVVDSPRIADFILRPVGSQCQASLRIPLIGFMKTQF